ncbi:MAG: hypothetical protein KF830_07825, partial [Planctomycetes bacterium]|nr:hypothetical protein [Planctomycetota bacterium]
LDRRDVLLLSVPGPLVGPETVALLERAVAEERLSLVVVIAHAACRTLTPAAAGSPAQAALQRRLDAAREAAERAQSPLPAWLARRECDQLLAASDALRQQVARDALRLVPAVVDERTGALAWHLRRSDEYALPPVR